jgi:predicted MPP superfamily phosphohydrolase
MRRDSLSPPRPVGPEALAALAALAPVTSEAAEQVPERPVVFEPGPVRPAPREGRLDEPSRAAKRRRHLFDPQHGWVRRVEREASLVLARHIYPRIPLISRPYDHLLRRTLTLSEAAIALPGLPAAFDGLRVLLVTDPHAGPFVSPPALGDAMERLQSVRPDLIVIGGDLTSSKLSEFAAHREAFEVLRAPLGVYAVLGNHDHYTQRTPELMRQVEALGIRMLHNRSVDIVRDGERLSLAGIDDLNKGQPDLDAALAQARPPVVLVSHNPDVLFEAAARNVALVLSGHTHAGQIRVPGLPVLVRQSRYRLDEGRYRHQATELVVSRGLGAVGLPWRAWCPPEGVLLTLRRS